MSSYASSRGGEGWPEVRRAEVSFGLCGRVDLLHDWARRWLQEMCRIKERSLGGRVGGWLTSGRRNPVDLAAGICGLRRGISRSGVLLWLGEKGKTERRERGISRRKRGKLLLPESMGFNRGGEGRGRDRRRTFPVRRNGSREEEPDMRVPSVSEKKKPRGKKWERGFRGVAGLLLRVLLGLVARSWATGAAQ
jgi:hypothetical protein